MCSVCEFCAGFSTVVEILKVKTHGSSSSTGRKLPVCQTPSVVLRVVQFYNIHTYILHPTTTAVCEVIITKNKEENDDLFEWFADTSTLLLPAANKRRTINSTATTPTTLERCAASSCWVVDACPNRREELALKESLCEEEPQQPQFSSSTLEYRVLLKL